MIISEKVEALVEEMLRDARAELVATGWITPSVRGVYRLESGELTDFRLDCTDNAISTMLRHVEEHIKNMDTVVVAFCSETWTRVTSSDADTNRLRKIFCYTRILTQGLSILGVLPYRRVGNSVEICDVKYFQGSHETISAALKRPERSCLVTN